MTDKIPIPTPTTDQKIKMTMKFNDTFGIDWKKIRKEQLALMVINQSAHLTRSQKDQIELTKIGMALKRQRDWFHKLIRGKEGLESKKSKSINTTSILKILKWILTSCSKRILKRQ